MEAASSVRIASRPTLRMERFVQELLRHANSRITLDLYAQAGMAGKREAPRKVVEMVLKKGKAVA